MSKAPTLEQVIAAFDHWRATRKSAKETIPVELKQQAVALKKRYQRAQIIHGLKISGGQYTQWLTAFAREPVSFVALPPAAVETQQLVIHHPQGGRLEMSGLSTAQLACVVRSFIGQEAQT